MKVEWLKKLQDPRILGIDTNRVGEIYITRRAGVGRNNQVCSSGRDIIYMSDYAVEEYIASLSWCFCKPCREHIVHLTLVNGEVIDKAWFEAFKARGIE